MASTANAQRKYNYYGLIPEVPQYELQGSIVPKRERSTTSPMRSLRSTAHARPTNKKEKEEEIEPPSAMLESLGLDPKWEHSLPFADTSILVTSQGRYRFEKMLPPLPPEPPLPANHKADKPSESVRVTVRPTKSFNRHVPPKGDPTYRTSSTTGSSSGVSISPATQSPLILGQRSSDLDDSATIHLTEYLGDGYREGPNVSAASLPRPRSRPSKFSENPNRDRAEQLYKQSREYMIRGDHDRGQPRGFREHERREYCESRISSSNGDTDWEAGHDRESSYRGTSDFEDEYISQSDTQTQSDYRVSSEPPIRKDSRAYSDIPQRTHWKEKRQGHETYPTEMGHPREARPRPSTAQRHLPYNESVARDSAESFAGTISSISKWPTPPAGSRLRVPSEASFDTKTPVVIVSDSQSADDASSTRHQGEQPGEKLILERCCKAAPTFEDPFLTTFLRAFKHTLTGDLRLVTSSTDEHGIRSVETHRVKPKEAKLVPMYAYDYKQRNLLYFQEDKGDNLGIGSHPISSSSSNEPMLLSPIYEFNSFQDALDFQGRILDEDVLFDISNIRYIKLAVTGSSERQIDSPRVQLWHQQKSTRRVKEGASFVTSGTSLSSADPERTVLLTSRLVMFLGRAQEFLTLFVTDDTTIKEKGATTLAFHPTKYAGLDRWKSRKSIRCRLVTGDQGGGAAGVRLDKKGLRSEDEESVYTQHKTFEMTFENEQGRISFIQSWNHVLEVRRAERMRLKKIASSMSSSTFTGAVATKIIF